MMFPDCVIAVGHTAERGTKLNVGPPTAAAAGLIADSPSSAGRRTERFRLVIAVCIGIASLAGWGGYIFATRQPPSEPGAIVREFMLKNSPESSSIEFLKIEAPVPLKNAVIWTGGNADEAKVGNERPWETFREEGWAVAVTYRMAEHSGATRLREVTYLLNGDREVFRTIVGQDRLEAATDSPNFLLVEQTAQDESSLHAESIE